MYVCSTFYPDFSRDCNRRHSTSCRSLVGISLVAAASHSVAEQGRSHLTAPRHLRRSGRCCSRTCGSPFTYASLPLTKCHKFGLQGPAALPVCPLTSSPAWQSPEGSRSWHTVAPVGGRRCGQEPPAAPAPQHGHVVLMSFTLLQSRKSKP